MFGKALTLIVWGIVAVLPLGSVFASEMALRLLIRAFENGGDNPQLIRSAYAEFQVDTTTNLGGEASTSRKQIKVLMSGNNVLFSTGDVQKCKRRLEVTETPEWANEATWTTVTISMGSPNQQNSYIAFEWKPGQLLLERRRGQRDALWLPEFQRFGRIYCINAPVSFILHDRLNQKNFTFPERILAEFEEELKKQNLTCEIVGEVNYDGDAIAKVIEIKRNGVSCERYHIDGSRGYICTYMWSGNEETQRFTEISAQEYHQEKQTSLFFPKVYKVRNQYLNKKVHSEEYRLLPETLRFNQPVSDREFALDIPENASVHDWTPLEPLSLVKPETTIVREVVPYRTVKNGTISLSDGGYDLPNLSWLVREDKLADYVPPRGGASGWVRWMLMGIGTAMIVFALYQKWKNRVAQ